MAALEKGFELIHTTLLAGTDASADQTPDGVLSAMGGAYAVLILDRDLLMLQVHALLFPDTTSSAPSAPLVPVSLRI